MANGIRRVKKNKGRCKDTIHLSFVHFSIKRHSYTSSAGKKRCFCYSKRGLQALWANC